MGMPWIGEVPEGCTRRSAASRQQGVSDQERRSCACRRLTTYWGNTWLIDQATQLYAEGRSLAEVGEQLDVEASTVEKALKRVGVKLRPPVADRWHASRGD